MASFTHYWSRETVEEPGAYLKWGLLGNQFRKRGVQSGDTVYVISFHAGRLRVLGRMVVSGIADKPSKGFSEHVHARRGTATRVVFDAWLKAADTKRLEFVTPGGQFKSPKLRPDGSVDPQTFRGVREITPKSAAILDSYLP